MGDELTERLKAATGPDRALDAALFAAVCTWADFEDGELSEVFEPLFETADDGIVIARARRRGTGDTHYRGHRYAPHYTSSLDAALPGEDIFKTLRGSDGSWMARDSRAPGGFCVVAPTEVLARRRAAYEAMTRWGGER